MNETPAGDGISGEHPFAALQPALLLDMLESAGVRADGRLLALNSYENRVYQLGVEDDAPLILKVYRPGRWSDASILEEHAFADELAALDIPVVPPLATDGRTLHHASGFRFGLYPCHGGHAPELDDADTREWLGRLLGRLHAVGEAASFRHRSAIDPDAMGKGNRDWLLESGWIPPAMETGYRQVTDELLSGVDAAFHQADGRSPIRLHGDLHPGNILWTDHGPHIVDLDDSRSGPAVQDIWMLLSGGREERTVQLADLLAGYERFHDFDPRELHLLEALRTLRLISYAAWLASRWDDPAFPVAFTWFGTERYWEDHVLTLREQVAAMQEPPLPV
ncbi:serine/threonine protein kinase [Spiribacter sp. 221]|uniref:serine/threonine protein kinase n=1 Tax=Spiribacter onubensis TaxID=3122420 RepID=UPI00349F7AB2